MNDKTPQQYWNEKFAATEDLVYTETVNRFVKELSEGLKPGKMIDLAGGEGRNAVYFAELGWQAENIDISNVGLTKFLKFAEERGVSEKVFANCADATGFESVLTPVDLGVVASVFGTHATTWQTTTTVHAMPMFARASRPSPRCSPTSRSKSRFSRIVTARFKPKMASSHR